MSKEKTAIQKWKNLSEDEKWILGRPNFACGHISRRLREKGFDCPAKSEDEQALVIFVMLRFYKEHGEVWREKMNEYLKSDETQL